jgi:hypothetical protein
MKTLLSTLLLAFVYDVTAVVTISLCAQCLFPWLIALFLAAALGIAVCKLRRKAKASRD